MRIRSACGEKKTLEVAHDTHHNVTIRIMTDGKTEVESITVDAVWFKQGIETEVRERELRRVR